MENILIHGLGQDEKSWEKIEENLKKEKIKVKSPNLFNLMENKEFNYKNLYKEFSKFCNDIQGQVNLCGISLGGILALDYAKENIQKVNSLILIGVPYDIPKKLFKIQNIIFKVMPKSVFTQQMGCKKKDCINLLKSMENLDIKKNLNKIECNTLVICGENDKANLEGSKLLNKYIGTSELEIIENCKHEANKEKPEELSDIICKFWSEDLL